MSKLSRYIYLILLIVFFPLTKSNLFESLENKLQFPILKLAINGQKIKELEKIIILRFLSQKELNLNEFNISENIPFLGEIKFGLNDMILKISNNTDADIFFVEENNLNVILNNFQGKINFNYKFFSKIITGEGQGSILIKNLSLQVNNTLIQVKNNYEPEKDIIGVKIDLIKINDIQFEFNLSKNGTFEKLAKYFNQNLKKFLINVLKKEISKIDTIKQINSKLLDIFKNINLNIPIKIKEIDDELKLSFSIDEKPYIKNHFLEISLKGEIKGNNYIYDKINNITLPCIINNTELISDKNINSIISQFIINNILDVFYFYGKFNIDITHDTLNLKELNIGEISIIIKEMKAYYNRTQEVKIMTKAISSPLINLYDKNIIQITLNENLKFFVFNESENSNKRIGTIPVDADTILQIMGNFNIDESYIKLNIKSILMKAFEIKKSLIGDINTENVINQFDKTINNSFVLSFVNQKVSNITEEIKQKIINYQGINFSDIYGKSYENYIKIDISPFLVSSFDLIYY